MNINFNRTGYANLYSQRQLTPKRQSQPQKQNAQNLSFGAGNSSSVLKFVGVAALVSAIGFSVGASASALGRGLAQRIKADKALQCYANDGGMPVSLVPDRPTDGIEIRSIKYGGIDCAPNVKKEDISTVCKEKLHSEVVHLNKSGARIPVCYCVSTSEYLKYLHKW